MSQTQPVRTLIVDDSSFYRGMLTSILGQDPQIEIVGTANNPYDAREKIKQLNPDVITLDIEMPKMNGLEFLEKIMRLRPMPVVMISTLTQAAATETIKALEIGAVDFHPKPTSADASLMEKDGAVLCNKVKAAVDAKVGGGLAASTPAPDVAPIENYQPGNGLVAIGASTGGVEAISQVLKSFPENCPPTVITQHMPPGFTKSFAERLDRHILPRVVEATDGMPFQVGQVAIAPGGDTHLIVKGTPGKYRASLLGTDPVSGHRPSVDMLFDSVAKSVGGKASAAILTGMGRDGADGLKKIRDAGGHTIGQDETSCVVFGMPRVADEIGGVEELLPLRKIGNRLLQLTRRGKV